MESYVVRIYRRSEATAGAASGASLVGLVEPTDGGATQPFRNVAELWRILLRDQPDAGASPGDSR